MMRNSINAYINWLKAQKDNVIGLMTPEQEASIKKSYEEAVEKNEQMLGKMPKWVQRLFGIKDIK